MLEKAIEEGAVLIPCYDETTKVFNHGATGEGKTSLLEDLVHRVLSIGGEVHTCGDTANRMFKHFHRVSHYPNPYDLMSFMWDFHRIRTQYPLGTLNLRMVLVTGPVPDTIRDDMQTFAEDASATLMAVVHAQDEQPAVSSSSG